MAWLVAVDPGLRGCGIAIFENALLHVAWYCKSPNKADRGPVAWWAMADRVEKEWIRKVPKRLHHLEKLVAEIPQVYRFGKGDPADLIEIAGVVGAIAFCIPAAGRTHFLPRTWKGQVPKEAHHPRILKKLSSDEVSRIESTPKSLMHNVVDAIGIGLFALERR